VRSGGRSRRPAVIACLDNGLAGEVSADRTERTRVRLRQVRSGGGAVVLSGLRAKLWRRKLEQQEARSEPAVDERSSGEEAIETADEEAAEEAPSGMTRLKTDDL
jgi:hypothetical protein